jgi:hypothetical protein
MPWERRFGEPIALLDGRSITTLSDARELALAIAPQAQRPASWRYVAELLKEAAAGRASLTEVEEMIMRALNAEHMV